MPAFYVLAAVLRIATQRQLNQSIKMLYMM